jgi:hypothetical protein
MENTDLATRGLLLALPSQAVSRGRVVRSMLPHWGPQAASISSADVSGILNPKVHRTYHSP